jgi:hypothetical protein
MAGSWQDMVTQATAIARQFAQHYYQTFDTNPPALAALYVSTTIFHMHSFSALPHFFRTIFVICWHFYRMSSNFAAASQFLLLPRGQTSLRTAGYSTGAACMLYNKHFTFSTYRRRVSKNSFSLPMVRRFVPPTFLPKTPSRFTEPEHSFPISYTSTPLLLFPGKPKFSAIQHILTQLDAQVSHPSLFYTCSLLPLQLSSLRFVTAAFSPPLAMASSPTCTDKSLQVLASPSPVQQPRCACCSSLSASVLAVNRALHLWLLFIAPCICGFCSLRSSSVFAVHLSASVPPPYSLSSICRRQPAAAPALFSGTFLHPPR